MKKLWLLLLGLLLSWGIYLLLGNGDWGNFTTQTGDYTLYACNDGSWVADTSYTGCSSDTACPSTGSKDHGKSFCCSSRPTATCNNDSTNSQVTDGEDIEIGDWLETGWPVKEQESNLKCYKCSSAGNVTSKNANSNGTCSSWYSLTQPDCSVNDVEEDDTNIDTWSEIWWPVKEQESNTKCYKCSSAGNVTSRNANSNGTCTSWYSLTQPDCSENDPVVDTWVTCYRKDCSDDCKKNQYPTRTSCPSDMTTRKSTCENACDVDDPVVVPDTTPSWTLYTCQSNGTFTAWSSCNNPQSTFWTLSLSQWWTVCVANGANLSSNRCTWGTQPSNDPVVVPDTTPTTWERCEPWYVWNPESDTCCQNNQGTCASWVVYDHWYWKCTTNGWTNINKWWTCKASNNFNLSVVWDKACYLEWSVPPWTCDTNPATPDPVVGWSCWDQWWERDEKRDDSCGAYNLWWIHEVGNSSYVCVNRWDTPSAWCDPQMEPLDLYRCEVNNGAWSRKLLSSWSCLTESKPANYAWGSDYCTAWTPPEWCCGGQEWDGWDVLCCDGTFKANASECPHNYNSNAHLDLCVTCCDGTNAVNPYECPEDMNGNAPWCKTINATESVTWCDGSQYLPGQAPQDYNGSKSWCYTCCDGKNVASELECSCNTVATECYRWCTNGKCESIWSYTNCPVWSVHSKPTCESQCTQKCSLEGQSCNDGDSKTKNTTYDENCRCTWWTPVVGIPPKVPVCWDSDYTGSDKPWNDCNDWNAFTINDVYNQNCKCVWTPKPTTPTPPTPTPTPPTVTPTTPTPTPTTPTPTPDVDCKMSAWVIGDCKANGKRTDTRTITTQPQWNGEACKNLIRNPNCGEYDLALAKKLKTGQPSKVKVGDLVTFTITVTNEGQITANTFTITDNLPAQLILADADWSINAWKASFPFIVINKPLAPGASTSVDITTKVVALINPIRNRAQISADDGNDIDSDPTTWVKVDDLGDSAPDDDEDSAIIRPIPEVCNGKDENGDWVIDEWFEDKAPGTTCDDGDDDTTDDTYNGVCKCVGTPIAKVYDLAIDKKLKTGQSRRVKVGDQVTYTITVTNQGSITANSFTIEDNLWVHLAFDDTDWNVIAPRSATYDITTPLAPWASTSVEITTKVIALGPKIRNRVQISVDDGDDIDSDPDKDYNIDEDGDGKKYDDDEDAIHVLPVIEICNGLDENNDWVTDEGFEDKAPGTTCDDDNGMTINDMYNDTCECVWTTRPDGDEDDHDVAEVTIIVETICCDGTTVEDADQCPTDDNGNAEGCHTAPEYTCCDETVVSDADLCPVDTNGTAEGCESPEYDLALTKDLKTGQSRAVTKGSEVTFTITVTNQWDITANTFEITDHIPTGLTLQDVDWTDAWNNKAEYIVTTPLVAWASIDVDITVLVWEVTGELINVAEISADDGDDIDSDPSNDDGDQSEDDEDPEPLTVINTEVCDGIDNDNDNIVDEWFEDKAEWESCDDNNDSTINDRYNATCICIGTPRNTWGWWGSAWGGNFCGDGKVFERLWEECDDGNYEDGDGCDRNCKVEPICGDGVPNQDIEQCDDGNLEDNDGCSKDCLVEIVLTCGDGSPNQEWEQCDDGNTTDGDGCSATCQIESLDQDIVEMILKKKEPIVVPAPVRITTPLILPKTGAELMCASIS